MTRTPLSRSKVKGQGHQAALLTAVLARQAAAAVGVGTCWPWETAAMLPSARRRKALRRPRGEERGGGISWRTPTYSLLLLFFLFNTVSYVLANKDDDDDDDDDGGGGGGSRTVTMSTLYSDKRLQNLAR